MTQETEDGLNDRLDRLGAILSDKALDLLEALVDGRKRIALRMTPAYDPKDAKREDGTRPPFAQPEHVDLELVVLDGPTAGVAAVEEAPPAAEA